MKLEKESDMNQRANTAWRFLVLSCALLLGVCANATAKELNGYYEGDDGGAYFVRQIGDKIYWLGEDPKGGWANILIRTVAANKITAKLFDVPKGKTKGTG